MSDSYRKIYLTVNAETGKIVDSAGSELSSSFWPAVSYGEKVIFCLSFVDSDSNVYPFNADDVFEFSMDKDFVHEVSGEDDPLMAYSNNDEFDVADDWADIDRASGKISVRGDFLTTGYLEKIGSNQQIIVWLEAKRYLSGQTTPSVIMQSRGYAKNVVHLEEAEPAAADPDYYTAVQTDALLEAKADKDTDAVAGNVAYFDSNGNPVDSGTSLSDILTDMSPQGSWDADANSPALPGTASTGDYWIVSVAGTTDLDGITDWQVNDWAVKTASGWAKIDNSETGKVKASSGDSSPDYLDGKVDDSTIEVTGNQLAVKEITASKVSDFDTEVENNTEVSANTTSRHTHANQTKLDDYDILTTNTTVNFTYDMTAAAMQALIDAVPKNLGGHDLTFQFGDGTYNTSMTSALTFNGFYNGSLYIQGNSGDTGISTTKAVKLVFSGTSSGVRVTNCSCNFLYVRYLDVEVPDSAVTYGIRIYSCICGEIRPIYNYIHGNGKTTESYGIKFDSSNYAGVCYGNYISNIKYAFGIYASCVSLSDNDDTGTAPDYGVQCSFGVAFTYGTQVSGTVADTELINNGQVVPARILTMPSSPSKGDMLQYDDTTGVYIGVDASGAADGDVPTVQADGTIAFETPPGASGGEVNTASNLGSGAGLYEGKSGVDLQFNSLVAGDGLSISEDDANDEIDVELDISGLTEESSPASGDYFVMYDTSESAYRKVDSDNMPGSGSGSGGGGEYGTASDLTLSSGSVTPTATTHKFSVIPENYSGSTMTASPSATDTTITVTSGTNFSQGQRVKIQDNTYSEYGWIKSVSSNTLTLYSGLTNGYDHTDGGEVLIMSDTLTTLASTNVNEGTVILVKPKYDGSIIEVDNGGGNIIVPDGCNAYLPTTGETMFVYDGSNWKMLNNYGVLFEDIVIFFDNSMSAATINGLSASVPRNMGPNNLTFQFLDGTYSALSEALSFNGFIGSGTLSILGNSGDYSLSTSKSVELQFSAGLNGINILNNTNSIIALYALKISIQQQSGVTINGINSNGNSAYTYCRFNYILCDGKTYTSYGVYVNYNVGYFWLQSNYVSNLSTGIYASNCGNVNSTNTNDTGTAPNYGLVANAAIIFKNSTQPSGTTSNESTSGGGQIF